MITASITVLFLVIIVSLSSGVHHHAKVRHSEVVATCRKYVGRPPVAGSTYFSYKGVAVNLPPGTSCTMPDGAVFRTDR
jgi:hypothetical protein